MRSHAYITHLPWKIVHRIATFLHPNTRRALCDTCTHLRLAIGRGTRVLRLAFPPLDVTAPRLARVFVLRHRIRVLTARRAPGFCTGDKLGPVGAAMLAGALDIGAGLAPRGLCIQVLDLAFQNMLDDGARALGKGLLAVSASLTRCRGHLLPTHTHASTHAHAHPRARTHTHVHMHMHTHTYIHTHTHMQTHTQASH